MPIPPGRFSRFSNQVSLIECYLHLLLWTLQMDVWILTLLLTSNMTSYFLTCYRERVSENQDWMKVAYSGTESSSALLASLLYPFHIHSGPADWVISGQLSPKGRLSWLSELIRAPLKNLSQQRVWAELAVGHAGWWSGTSEGSWPPGIEQQQQKLNWFPTFHLTSNMSGFLCNTKRESCV